MISFCPTDGVLVSCKSPVNAAIFHVASEIRQFSSILAQLFFPLVSWPAAFGLQPATHLPSLRYRGVETSSCDHHSTATWRQYLPRVQLISSTILITCASSNSVVGCPPCTWGGALSRPIMSPLEVISFLLWTLPMR